MSPRRSRRRNRCDNQYVEVRGLGRFAHTINKTLEPCEIQAVPKVPRLAPSLPTFIFLPLRYQIGEVRSRRGRSDTRRHLHKSGHGARSCLLA